MVDRVRVVREHASRARSDRSDRLVHRARELGGELVSNGLTVGHRKDDAFGELGELALSHDHPTRFGGVSGFLSGFAGGVDGTRTRGLRRDRPAF